MLHAAYLLEINHLEACDIHAEFLRDHPNGGARTAGLVAVSLSDAQIAALQTECDRVAKTSLKKAGGIPEMANLLLVLFVSLVLQMRYMPYSSPSLATEALKKYPERVEQLHEEAARATTEAEAHPSAGLVASTTLWLRAQLASGACDGAAVAAVRCLRKKLDRAVRV